MIVSKEHMTSMTKIFILSLVVVDQKKKSLVVKYIEMEASYFAFPIKYEMNLFEIIDSDWYKEDQAKSID